MIEVDGNLRLGFSHLIVRLWQVKIRNREACHDSGLFP
jgi:hypothetical protein